MSNIKYQMSVLLGAVFALLFAFYWQYAEGLHPCELCIWQRWGYVVVILFSFLAVIPAKAGIQPRRWIPAFAGMTVSALLAVEVGIAIYHTGIEQHWWQGFQKCSSSLDSGQTLDEIRAKLAATPLVRCDDIAWKFLGLSMAAWNAVYAFGLFLISVIPCRKSS